MPSPLIHAAIDREAHAARREADAAAAAWQAAQDRCAALERALEANERRPAGGTSAQLEALRSARARALGEALPQAEQQRAALAARWRALETAAEDLARQQRGLAVLAERERAAEALARRRAEDREEDEHNDRAIRPDPFGPDPFGPDP